MLTVNRMVLACLLLALVASAEAPFYTSQKMGLLVRWPPGWKVEEGQALVISDPSGVGRARFEVMPGADAAAVWKKAAADLRKAHPDFEVTEQLAQTSRACLLQARFREGSSDWSGTYAVKSFGSGKWLVSASEARAGADGKIVAWLGSVLESATPVR